MSGSKEERPTAADVTVESETAPEAAAGSDVEMSAAEALARATEAAAAPSSEEAAPAEQAVSEPAAPADSEASSEEPPAAAVDEETQPVTPQVQDAQTEENVETAPEVEAETTEPATEAAPEVDAEKPPVEAAAEAEEPTVEAAAETEEPTVEAAAETESKEQPVEAAAEVETAEPIDQATPEIESKEAATEPTGEVEPELATGEVESEEPTVGSDTAQPTVETAPDTDGEAPAVEATPKSSAAEPPAAEAAPGKAAAAKAKKKKKKQPVRTKPKTPLADRPELRPVLKALESRTPMEGRVIGWNHGGFHLALGELSAFCPRSEMEIGEINEPESYLDQTFEFRVLRLQGKGRRIVVSRAAQLRNDKSRQRSALRKKLQEGAELDGTVASLKDFGAFVDLGGSQGLVHVSEISHRRVEHPSDVLSEGQEVRVKVLKVEQGGKRISLSMRALEPNPWKDLADRFPQGAVVTGTVEKANQIGAFIELAPGLTGLLPARSMTIPRETTPARAYPPGKEVSVQIVSIDPRRQRISLGLEGSGLEGSRNDYKDYQRQSREEGQGEGFNALASAFRRLQGDAD